MVGDRSANYARIKTIRERFSMHDVGKSNSKTRIMLIQIDENGEWPVLKVQVFQRPEICCESSMLVIIQDLRVLV